MSRKGEKDLKCLALRPLSAAIQRVAVYETKLVSYCGIRLNQSHPPLAGMGVGQA